MSTKRALLKCIRRRKQVTAAPQSQAAGAPTIASNPKPSTHQKSTPQSANPTTPTDSQADAMTAQLNRCFFNLPREIREDILLYSMLPLPKLSTASVPNTPDVLRIPPVAQVCRSLRSEATGVFFRNRPLEIALYSNANEQLTQMWLSRWTQYAAMWRHVTFTGTIRYRQGSGDFFKVGVVCLRGAGKHLLTVAPGSTPGAHRVSEVLTTAMTSWLARRVASEEFGLTVVELKELVKLILSLARLEPFEIKAFEETAEW